MKISEIIGHSEQLGLMVKAHKAGRLAHAYLFFGPDGIGKKSAAMAFIKYVFCQNPDGVADSCSNCAPCRKIETGNHPDLITLEPENSLIKINMIRDMKKKLNYGKYDAKCRFCLIDDAEKMRAEAANALLKTLEEPASDTVIILVTSKVNMLLPTIVSRCQKVRFNPIGAGEIKRELVRSHGLSDDEADIISGFLQGSFSRLDTEDFDRILELRRTLVKKIKDISLHNLTGIINLSGEISKADKELLVENVEIIKTFYRDAAMLRNGMEGNLINRDIASDIRKIASVLTLEDIFEKINIMNQIQSSLMANVNKKLAVESMLIELCVQ